MAQFQKGHPGGPGRPKKRDKFAGAIVKGEKRIADRLPELIDWQFELAAGVWVEETTKDGERKVYKRPPDREAGQYLINRIMGKPIERQEIGGVDGGLIEVAFVDYRAGVAGTQAGSDEDRDPSGED